MYMKQTIQYLKRVYQYGKDYKRNLIFFSIISICNIFINIAFPIFTAKQLVALTSSLYMELFMASLICFGMSFLSNLTIIIIKKNAQIFFRGTTKAIQLHTAKEILKIELTSIDKNGSGTFIQRIHNDTDEMSRIFTNGIGILTQLFTDIGIFISIFIINKIVFCFFFICTTLLTTFYLIKTKKVNEADEKYRNQREKNSSFITELIRGIRDIKMLYAKKSFIDKMEESIDDSTKSKFDFTNIEMVSDFFIDSFYDICELLLIILFIYLLTHNLLTASSAIVLYNYRYRIFSYFMYNIGQLLQQVKSFNLSCERVFSIIDDTDFHKETFGNQHIDVIRGNFEFKNVYFGYDKMEVLKGIHFKVKENETVAFVGKSGAGKTTIFSLLCKLYSISSGHILLDGIDINTLDEESIRNNITIISQNPYIFNMSIKDNFRLVKSDVTDEEIIKASKLACLDNFIQKLPDGYDTIVGEGGVTLSGGQRQRLAIARAFVQNTKIILFDEATSALDNETQKSIQQAIYNMKEKYTILIIAHRLSTIVSADRIMLVEDGKITDAGTHKELLLRNKTYKKLYESEILDKN